MERTLMRMHHFTNTKELNQAFAQQISMQLTEAITSRGEAWLVVSGGKTPASFFKTLAQQVLDWSRVTITLTDERCLPPEHPERNASLVKHDLLHDLAGSAHFIELTENESLFKKMPMFDVVILGMGEDGHTASLFPCSEQIKQGLLETSDALLIVNPKTAAYQRISLSKNRLLNTRSLYLHFVGEKKKMVFERACQGEDEKEMPIRAFLHSAIDMQVMYTME